MHPYLILVICSGNMCRSPLYAVLLTLAIKLKRLKRPTMIMSAGTNMAARNGFPATDKSVTALEARGFHEQVVQLNRHHSRWAADVLSTMVFDEIIVMDEDHKTWLRKTFPQLNMEKVRVVPGGIPDPYGKDQAAYDTCLQKMVRDIKELTGQEV